MASNDSNGIFVTGATGFIGSNLVVRFLKETNKKIFCLVRPRGDSSYERLKKSIMESARSAGLTDEIEDRLKNLHAVSGDLTQELLGLSKDDISNLNRFGVKYFWHSAASLRYEEIYRDEIFKHNAEGTKHAVALAKMLNISEFNYISTAYVAGKKKGNIEESFFDDTTVPCNFYEESKRQGEKIVLNAKQDADFLVRIFRPSIVIGHSTTYDSTTSTGYYGFISAIERFVEWIRKRMPNYFEQNPLKIFREKGTSINLIPIDIMIDDAMAIIHDADNTSEIHHLTNPFHHSLYTVISSFNNIFDGVNIIVTEDLQDLGPVDNIFRDKLKFYNPYLQNDKTFSRRQNIENLSDSLDFDTEQLDSYSELFIERYRKKRLSRKDQSENILEKNEIVCRFGNKLTYFSAGEGPTIVFINAYGTSLQVWKPMVAYYARNYKIITWESRGLKDIYDKSSGERVFFNVEDHVEDMEEILAHEGIEKVIIIAWCSGGKTALKFCADSPSRVNNLSIIGGSFQYPFNTFEETEWMKGLNTMATVLENTPQMARVFMNTIARSLSINQGEDSESTIDERLDRLMKYIDPNYTDVILNPFINEEAMKNYTRMIRDFSEYDITDCLNKIKAPTLIIAAEKDGNAHPEQSKDVAKDIIGAKYICMPAATHWLIMENSEEICALQRPFLENLTVLETSC